MFVLFHILGFNPAPYFMKYIRVFFVGGGLKKSTFLYHGADSLRICDNLVYIGLGEDGWVLLMIVSIVRKEKNGS